jgi:predicted ABC-type ATPase
VPKRKTLPRCIVIAGPNGAGKTTFARRYLPEDEAVIHFVNADLIASGWTNFKDIYRPLADVWTLYDNSGRAPRLLEKSE